MATRKAGKPAEIKPLSRRPRRYRIMLYSHPGVGKSRLAGSSVELGPTLILNADGPDGPESMRTAGYDPDTWDVKSIKDLDEAFDYIRHGGADDYDWVWLDSITLFEEAEMEAIMSDLVRKSPHRDIHLPDKPQYMLRQNHISRWVRRMKGQRINFGMTAHVMSVGVEDEDEDRDTAQYMPAIQGGQGKLSSNMCAHFGIVGRLHIAKRNVKLKGGDTGKKSKHVLQVQPSERWYAKDRLSGDRLGSEVVDPTMAKIIGLIGDSGKEKDGNQDQVRRVRKRPGKGSPRRR